MIQCHEIKTANARTCDLIEKAQDTLHEGMLSYELLKDALIQANVMRIALNRIANGSPTPMALAHDALRYEKPSRLTDVEPDTTVTHKADSECGAG